MITERQIESYWTAQGNGPLRFIAAEGETRREAVLAFTETFRDQQAEYRLRFPFEIIDGG